MNKTSKYMEPQKTENPKHQENDCYCCNHKIFFKLIINKKNIPLIRDVPNPRILLALPSSDYSSHS